MSYELAWRISCGVVRTSGGRPLWMVVAATVIGSLHLPLSRAGCRLGFMLALTSLWSVGFSRRRLFQRIVFGSASDVD
jgi:hypothetical protein